MRFAIRNAILSFCLAVFLLPALAVAAETGTVNAPSGLSLRAQPGTSGKILGRLTHGSNVEILQKDGPAQTIEGISANWFKVSSSGKTGWVFGGFIKPSAAAKVINHWPEKQSDETLSLSDNPDSEHAEAERKVKRQFGDKFERKGKILKLKFSNGKHLDLVDDDSHTDSRVLYHCLDYFPDEGLFLVHGALYEGTDYFFVCEKTGKTISLGGMPFFSPDRTRVAASNVDIIAGYDFNGIRIFRINNDELKSELELAPGEWGPQNPRWVSETEIVFEKYQGEETPAQTVKLIYNSEKQIWELK